MSNANTRPKNTLKWILIGVVLASLAGWWNLRSQGPAPKSEAEMVIGGGPLFAANCASCHGSQAVGENPAKVAGGMKEPFSDRARGIQVETDLNGPGYWAPALNGTAHAWHHSPTDLFNTIKNGSLAEDSQMRGFARRLSDEEIRMVLAYIQSLWPADIRARYRNTHNE